MPSQLLSGTAFPIQVWGDAMESGTERQLRNLAALPHLFRHVAAMADAHPGIGATVGSVIASAGMVIPAAVGVDIGCGVCAVRLPVERRLLSGGERLKQIRRGIERVIPLGFSQHRPEEVSPQADAWARTRLKPRLLTAPLSREIRAKARLQIGTLGGGNHFIEICCDEQDRGWVMLHSGSRHIGKRIADHYIRRAKAEMKAAGTLAALPDPNLAYFTAGSAGFGEYLADLFWAQAYARFNREEMMRVILGELAPHLPRPAGGGAPEALMLERVDCHHNYVARETHFGQKVYVTRKGALSAKKGEAGIVPGSMGTASYIVEGLGNAESFHSCAHGAGRAMSRKAARERFRVADLVAQTAGVECRKDRGVLDEIPQAYKDIDLVMAQQAELVRVRHRLEQLICVKG